MTKLLSRKGFVLPLSMVMMSLTVLISGSYFYVASNGLTSARRTGDLTRAYYLADAGLADAFIQLKNSANPPMSFVAANNAYPVSPTANGSYSTQVTANAWPDYTLTSTGTYNGVTRRLQLKIRASTASEWNYMSSTEIDPFWGRLWWVTGMFSDGKTHTDGQFNMFGTPVFAGPVTQVAPTVHYWSGPPADNPTFQQGLTVSAPAKFPSAAQSTDYIKAAAQQPTGRYFTGSTTITLVNNGTMNVTNAAAGMANTNIPVPANAALFVDSGSVTVQGVLKGKLTVGTSNNININGNILYKTDPRVDSTSTDILGLVAKNHVIVTSTAPFNVEVDGYIVALTGSFQVQNFWTFLKGNLVQYGGLTNFVCGPTGMFNPWTGKLVAGYNQLQYYDQRFDPEHNENPISPPWFLPMKSTSGLSAYKKVSFEEL